MCRVRQPMQSAAPIEVIVRHVEVVELDPGLNDRLADFEALQTKCMEPVGGDIAQRLKRLEEQAPGALPYQGVWREGTEYKAGQFVTFDGSLFHVDRDTSERPKGPDSGYTLAVKRGRNGKDAAQ